MSETFGAGAVRLAAQAARMLGWRPAEFWTATPAELATSLGLTDADPGAMLDRGELQRLMAKDENRKTDNDRPG